MELLTGDGGRVAGDTGWQCGRAVRLLQQKDDDTHTAALHILSLIDFSSANVKHSMLNKLKETLKQLATTSANPQTPSSTPSAPSKRVFTENTAAARSPCRRQQAHHEPQHGRRPTERTRPTSCSTSSSSTVSTTSARRTSGWRRSLSGIGEVSVYYPRLFKMHRDRIMPFFLKQLFVLQSVEQPLGCTATRWSAWRRF